MALTIYEFGGLTSTNGTDIQVPEGQPLVKHSTTGEKTMGANSRLIRITGTGTITWANAIAEAFDTETYRGVEPGTVFTVS